MEHITAITTSPKYYWPVVRTSADTANHDSSVNALPVGAYTHFKPHYCSLVCPMHVVGAYLLYFSKTLVPEKVRVTSLQMKLMSK